MGVSQVTATALRLTLRDRAQYSNVPDGKRCPDHTVGRGRRSRSLRLHPGRGRAYAAAMSLIRSLTKRVRKLRHRERRVDEVAGYDWATIKHNRIEIINRAVFRVGADK